MAELTFECLGARPDHYAAAPSMVFRLRITEADHAPVNAIALRCQLRIEPQRRSYSKTETPLLADLFGTPDRWGDSLKPLQFAIVAVMVPGFTGTTEIDLPVPCSYDMEVAAHKYFASLEDGEIPLLLLFSGTVFLKGPAGFAVQQVSWDCEAQHRLPVASWRELMDRYFPGSGWLRLTRETIAALQAFKADKALPTWDDAINALLERVRL
ncbi:MAG: hypothetical protein JWO67_4676 [Streptosporangiaceae bacterium]|jgi:hypothetical protein|nr:hypothetical protein [Streptosporangiaceae bacterium]